MPKLLAIAPADGWAFVEDRDGVHLVRPPYRRANMVTVSRPVVEKAVTHYAFEARCEKFDTWDALVDLLRAEIVRAHVALGTPVPEPGVGALVLPHLPPDIIAQYLDRIENELLPNGEFAAAMNLAQDLLLVHAVIDNDDLRGRARELLLQSRALNHRRAELRQQLVHEVEAADLAQSFPLSAHRYGSSEVAQLSEAISRRGQVFAIR